MPTTSTTSANGARRAPKRTRKATAARASTVRKPSAARRSSARRSGTVSRAPASAKARTTVNTRTADRAAETIGDYAERAVLIPVGAALVAREQIVSGVSDTVARYSSASKTKAQLRRFERRGATARNRLEREVRKVRVRVERELRQRRRELERTVNGIEERRDDLAKNGSELANRVQERILSLV